MRGWMGPGLLWRPFSDKEWTPFPESEEESPSEEEEDIEDKANDDQEANIYQEEHILEENIRPFHQSFYDHNDPAKPWYECLKPEKLYLLGLFSVLSYTGEGGSLGILQRLIDQRDGRSNWGDKTMVKTLEQRFEHLRMHFVKAGILYLSAISDWYFRDDEEHCADQVWAVVIDGLIEAGAATGVFKEAVLRLDEHISRVRMSPPTLRSILQMIKTYDRISERGMESEAQAKMDLDLKLEFVRLLQLSRGLRDRNVDDRSCVL